MMSRTAPGSSGSGSRPSYFPRQPRVEDAPEVLLDRRAPAQLDVVVRVVESRIVTLARGSRSRLRCLRRPATVEKEHVVAVAADPHRGGLRPAVRIDRRQHGEVAAVEQPSDLVVECDAHAERAYACGNVNGGPGGEWTRRRPAEDAVRVDHLYGGELAIT